MLEINVDQVVYQSFEMCNNRAPYCCNQSTTGLYMFWYLSKDKLAISVVCKHNQLQMFICASTMDTFNNVCFSSYSPQIYARWLGWWRGHGPVCRAMGAG